MSNPILERWAEVLAAGGGRAVLSPSGEVLRTWSDLEEEARGFESRLAGEKGGVALQTGNHPAFPALFLACLRAGRPAGLFDVGFSGEARPRLERQLGISTRVIFSGGKIVFEKGDGSCPGQPEQAVLFKLTSGTTSLPQSIGFTPEQLLADCDQVCGTMGIRAGDLNYGVIALTHSYGFSNLVTPLLCRGIPLVVASDPLPRALESGLRATGATVLPAVPAMFRGLLQAASLPASLRLCISAGAPLEPALAREFQERFGRKIHTFYGASECGGICYDASEEMVDLPGFVGTPLRGVEVGLAESSEGVKSTVRSRAVGLGMAGPSGGFQPSDLLVRANGGFRIVGRESDGINVAGKKVNPAEIEQAISQFPGVREVVVCGVENAARCQEIGALVAGEGLDISLLRRHCAGLMAGWKIPRRFVFAPEIPRNARGKISRPEIAKMFF